MDTKKQALEKAQEYQKNGILNWKERFISFVTTYHHKAFRITESGCEPVDFKYAKPKPLKRDTYVWVPYLKLYLYAMGDLDHFGCNKFYMPGMCSKNSYDVDEYLLSADFEVVETPNDLNKITTPDSMCIESGCKKYVLKWKSVESEKLLYGDCESCTILIGKPTGMGE